MEKHRYFLLLNPQTLEVYVSEPLEVQPKNSVLFFANNFVKAVFDSYPPNTVIEGMTLSEINNSKKIEAIEVINELYTKLYKSALERVTGKSGSFDYLKLQKEEYEKKYLVSCQLLNNETITIQNMINQLDKEKDFEDFEGKNLNIALQSLGLTTLNDRLKDFCQIVKFKYEYADSLFKMFEEMIVYFRTRMITDAELFDWEKYNQRLQMVLSINNQTTISQIETLYLEFQNI